MKKYFLRIRAPFGLRPERPHLPIASLCVSLLLLGCCNYEPPKVRGSQRPSLAATGKFGDNGENIGPVERAVILSGLKTGQTSEEAANVLSRAFTQVDSARLLLQLQDSIPYTNSGYVSSWRANWPQSDAAYEGVIVVFATTNKTSVVDALYVAHGALKPLVDGPLNRRLRSMKEGDSIDALYRGVGRRQCDYFRGPDGKWRVRFIYAAYPDRIIVVEADAASGRIISVGDGTL